MGTQLLGHSAQHDPMMLGPFVKHDPMMLNHVAQQRQAQMDTQLLGPFVKHNSIMLGLDGYLTVRSLCQDPMIMGLGAQERWAQLKHDSLKLGPASTRTQHWQAQSSEHDSFLLGIVVSRTRQRWTQSYKHDPLKLGPASTMTQQSPPTRSIWNSGDPKKTR